MFDERPVLGSPGDYAKAAPHDICLRSGCANAGPEAATLHVLPTLWFRNTLVLGDRRARPEARRTAAPTTSAAAVASTRASGAGELVAGPGPRRRPPTLLFCENETNTARLFGAPAQTPYPKDGINDHVVQRRGDGQPGAARHQGGLLVPV